MKHSDIPQCIGFIMDGNRRWAETRGLSSAEGHAKGYATLRTIVDVALDIKLPHMICYAFSTENWKRATTEVSYLMDLFYEVFIDLQTRKNKDKNLINIRVIGERLKLPQNLQKAIKNVETNSHTLPKLTIWIALSYGGRAEIIHAVNQAVGRRKKVTEESFSKSLWTHGLPDPDLIIRTGGEQRLSNFLLWQSAYSEFFFSDTKWPDFGEQEFRGILDGYVQRKRRHGK